MSFQAELLDIRNIITVNNAELISRHQETALKTAKIPDISILKAGSEKTRQRFKKARSISKKASNMRKGDEDLWVAFIKKKVFRGWGSSQKPKRPIDYFCLTGGVAMNGPSVQWNEAARHRDCPAKDVLTVPKPDIYFAIQIYENLPEPSRFSNQALQNFTFDVLNSCQDLHYSPSKRCVQPTEDYDKHQVCFPFIVIEVKHEDVTKTEVQHCYCQAANAASCALSMLCNLNQHNPSARYWHADQHKILPTVTFTFIGHNVKFWLAYITDYAPTEDKDHKHRYVSHLKIQKTSNAILISISEWNAFGVVTCANSGMRFSYVALLIKSQNGFSTFIGPGYLHA
ncbi:MAG: hypothetical protein LQ351_004269 [Letrouitia transgressa]|nr:MAG: hypothetical protein LQ351_004269 [Letrouitia transgressa]